MLDELDSIRWQELTHASGSAHDVPILLRAMAYQSTEPGPHTGETSALHSLSNVILHQGTVYEATSYVVPFLIELAAEPSTPDRPGILGLLAEIAEGGSSVATEATHLIPASAEELVQEATVREKAHAAVAAGFDRLTAIALEKDCFIRLAAARVLSRFPERAPIVAPLLRNHLQHEASSLARAGYLLLMGQVFDHSHESLAVLSTAVNSGIDLECTAAAFSLARLCPTPLPPGAREAMLNALIADHPEAILSALPWDVADEIDRNNLLSTLDEATLSLAAERLMDRIEAAKATHETISTLLEILFPTDMRAPVETVRVAELSPLQKRAVKAIASTVCDGNCVFAGHFPQWGLPDSRREWKDLAAGKDPTPVDMSLPLLADPRTPRVPVFAHELESQQRIVHRSLGIGTVSHIEKTGIGSRVVIDFDEEGTKTLLI